MSYPSRLPVNKRSLTVDFTKVGKQVILRSKPSILSEKFPPSQFVLSTHQPKQHFCIL